MQKIKNLPTVISLLKKKLPEYLQSQGILIKDPQLQCPNHKECHKHNDLGKLSASFLPNTNKTKIYCFVEHRTFDIFSCYQILEKKPIYGSNFYNAVIDLAKRFNIPIELEPSSPKEIELQKKQKLLEKIHKLSLTYIKKGKEYYKKRNLTKEKIKFYKIGYLEPTFLSSTIVNEFKSLFDYNILSVFSSPSLVIPVYSVFNQYVGLIFRQFDDETRYLNFFIKNGEKCKLFNTQNIHSEEIYLVEGVFDAIALYPDTNVVALLTNNLSEDNLSFFVNSDIKKVKLALDGDNFQKPLNSNGIYNCIERLKHLDIEVEILCLPYEDDPDSFITKKGIEEFKNLSMISSIDYLISLLKENKIKIEQIYDYIVSCPNLLRKDKYLSILADKTHLKKSLLAKTIEKLETKSKTNVNISKLYQEKENLENLLVEFEDFAWNKEFNTILSGFPLFDKYVFGFENTLYTFVGFPETGKTTFLLNLAYNLLNSNQKVYIAFYSIDDGVKRSILPRFLSIISGLKPYKFKYPTKDIKDIWYSALEKLKEFKNSLSLKDGAEIRTIFDLEEYIKLHYNIATEQGKSLVVIIDNIHKISASYKLGSTENSVKVASFLSKIPQIYNCCLITTAEVPKSSPQKPTGKDIKESIDIWYASRFVGGLFTDFFTNTATHLVHQVDEGKLNPIIELYVSKNQTGDGWHGSLFYKFFLDTSRLEECSEEERQLLLEKQFI